MSLKRENKNLKWQLAQIKNILQYENPIGYIFNNELQYINKIEFNNSKQVRDFLTLDNIKEVEAYDPKFHLIDLTLANGNSLHFEWI